MKALSLLTLFAALLGTPVFGLNYLRVIYMVDDGAGKIGDDITEGCKKGAKSLNALFSKQYNRPNWMNYQARQVTGDDLKPDNLYAIIDNLAIETGDTFLVYYCSHGGIDPNTNLQTFNTSHGDIPRADLENKIKSKNARLTVLLSDACSSFSGGGFGAHGKGPDWSKALDDLIFQSSGFVSITAASPGQVAWISGNQGGLLISSFVDLMKGDWHFLDGNNDGKVTWNEFYPQWTTRVREEFQKLKKSFPDKLANANDQQIYSYGTNVNP